MPDGGPATTLMTLGYDPQTKRVVGTWVGSMMTHMWVYDAELDPAGKVLALNSEGPSMEDDGTTSRYQDVIEFKSDDHRVLTARVQGADGQWQIIHDDGLSEAVARRMISSGAHTGTRGWGLGADFYDPAGPRHA